MRIEFWVALVLGASSMTALSEESAVPDWFRPAPDEPYAIYEAWRNLSTKEAALYLGPGWDVCAGVLRDEKGNPIANCPLIVSYHDGIRGYGARLRTDESGFYIVYSPYGRMPFDPERVTFRAAPGYPFTQMASAFASANRGYRKCSVRAVHVSDDRCFCFLTCARGSDFDEDAFRKFIEQEMADWKNRPRRPYRARPHAREGSTDRGTRNEYPVRVVCPEGNPIPDAVVQFTAYDGFEGNNQTVLTDPKGACTLVEELLSGREQKYYDGLRRWLTLDAPSHSVGPIPFRLKKNRISVIAAKLGATVSGKITDWNGEPFRRRVSVRYRNRSHCSFELDTSPAPDGHFAIGRIMPEEPFRLQVSAGSRQTTPSPQVWSGTLTLKPGETRRGIVLNVPHPAAIQGIVTDEKSMPVASRSVSFHNRDGGWGHGPPKGNRFGTYRLAPMPLRIKVRAAGFDPHESDEIPLRPGELRFVKVVMKRKSPDE